MPLYEYRCKNCGEQTEVLQRFDDAPLTTCAKCSGKLEKLLSAPAFHLKGSGWYKTDYATPKKGGEDGGSSSDKSSSGDSASEAKPAKSDKPESAAKTDSGSSAKSSSKSSD